MAESEYERVWKDYYLGVQGELLFLTMYCHGRSSVLDDILGYYPTKHSPASEFQE